MGRTRFNDLRFNDIPGRTINIRLPSKSYSKMYGQNPVNDLRFNDIPGRTINIRLPSKSYSKMYGAEPGLTIFGLTIFPVERSTVVCPAKVIVKCMEQNPVNDLRFNDIPGRTINSRLPSKSYSKMYGAEPGLTIFGLTIFPVERSTVVCPAQVIVTCMGQTRLTIFGLTIFPV